MKIIIIGLALLGTVAHADYRLASNGKKVVCSGEDNQSWELNKSRTTVKYTVEGESLGAAKITFRNTDDESYISYATEEGTLTLGPTDTYQFAGTTEVFEISCR
jgi:hypothetical protein